MEEKGYAYILPEPRFFQELKDHIKIENGKQQRIPQVDPFFTLLKTQRPYWFKGVFCKSQDVVSFMFEKEEILTSSINRDIETKTVVIKEDSK